MNILISFTKATATVQSKDEFRLLIAKALNTFEISSFGANNENRKQMGYSYLKIITFSSTLGTNRLSMKHRIRLLAFVPAPVFLLDIAAILSPIQRTEE